ncbi:MAG: helix-turn-helix domain-containing protein [Nanoarchaeota archaeon]|nr:helix-turn-helix domain-containing protein [Nanoarchaeota archaeon]
MEEELLETLKSIGLTNGESRVYVGLLSLGTSTVSPIVESSGISSSKVYFILNKLIVKGLVSMSVENKSKIYSATAPERILDYLDEREKIIKKHKTEISKIIPLLKTKKEFNTHQPPVEFTRGEKGYESIFNEVYLGLKEGDKYLALGGLRISFKMQNYWFKHSNLLSKKKIPQFTLYESEGWYKKDPSIHQREKRSLYYPRVLSKEYQDLPLILTIGDKAIISDVDEDGEIFTMLIRNTNLSNGLKRLLKILYNSSEAPSSFKNKEFND